MSAFDDLTLGEVEEMMATALGGSQIDAADPLMLAGGVMWVTNRRMEPSLSWDEFKTTTKMSDIKAFSIQMEADDMADPTNDRNVPAI
ncbi:MAG: hypothetical protein ABW007_02890 [Chitinophagaceae bacterium]